MSALLSNPYSEARLAAELKELNLPGQRSKTAILSLRRERRRRRDGLADEQLARVFGRFTREDKPRGDALEAIRKRLRDRTHRRLFRLYLDEIRRRGGETEIEGQYGTTHLSIADRDVRARMVLMRAEGWRKYGSHPARYVKLAYLCGVDDNGRWAVRVPGTFTSVRGALDWLTPAAVKKARDKGQRVWRQGDVYLIEISAHRDQRGVTDLPAAHRWNPATGYLTHRPADGRRHRPVNVGRRTYVEFVMQRAYEMGRTNTRGNAD